MVPHELFAAGGSLFILSCINAKPQNVREYALLFLLIHSLKLRFLDKKNLAKGCSFSELHREWWYPIVKHACIKIDPKYVIKEICIDKYLRVTMFVLIVLQTLIECNLGISPDIFLLGAVMGIHAYIFETFCRSGLIIPLEKLGSGNIEISIFILGCLGVHYMLTKKTSGCSPNIFGK